MAIKKKEENEVTKIITVGRVHQFKDGSVVFDMTINNVTIYNCRIVEGKNGDFVSFPSYKGNDNKYYRYAYTELDPLDVELIEKQINSML